MAEDYIPLEDLNKKKMNRLNPFENRQEGMQFAKNVAYGTGRAIKTIGQAVYGAVSQIPSRVMSAKQRSGFGVHSLGRGENFGIGTKGFGVRINTSNPLGYQPLPKPKTQIRYRTKYVTKTKYVYKKRR